MTHSLMSIENKDDILFTVRKSDIKKLIDITQNINIEISRNGLEKEKTENNNATNAFNLTSRELEVLKYLVQGKNNIKIADELKVSKYTIKAHVTNILQKLNVNDRFEAAIKAIKEKIV